MLVLRRRAGDSLLIGGDVEVEILEITPTRVKLGILAPDHVTIVRKEVHLTREQNVTAARKADPQAVSWLTGKLAKS
jgi:carbon storage regulator